MNTNIVQQVSKETYLKDAERVVFLKRMLYECSMKIEVQKAFIESGDYLFKSSAEANRIIAKYTRLYQYIRMRLINTSFKNIESL